MKVLLMSDNHMLRGLEMTVLSEAADLNIHLGDSQFMKNNIEMERFDYAVRGNCDFESYDQEIIIEVGGERWLLCHGYQIYNPHDLEALADFAKSHGCTVICYGHTHIPNYSRYDDITILNPGSFARSRCSYPNSYMTIEIENHNWTVNLHAANGQIIKELKING